MIRACRPSLSVQTNDYPPFSRVSLRETSNRSTSRFPRSQKTDLFPRELPISDGAATCVSSVFLFFFLSFERNVIVAYSYPIIQSSSLEFSKRKTKVLVFGFSSVLSRAQKIQMRIFVRSTVNFKSFGICIVNRRII